MQPTPKMQQLIQAIAAKHRFDLDQLGPSLRLFLADHDYLVIENIGNYRVVVTNYIQRDNQLLADPRVVFYTRFDPVNGSHQWLPLEATEVFTGWQMYFDVTQEGDDILLYDMGGQVRLAEECERVFARNIEQAGWLEKAVRVEFPRVIRDREDLMLEFDPFEAEYLFGEAEDDDQPESPE